MNLIHKLQCQVAELTAHRDALVEGVRDLKAHVAGAKFQGHDTDGSPRSWISTADVTRMVDEIIACAQRAADDAQANATAAKAA